MLLGCASEKKFKDRMKDTLYPYFLSRSSGQDESRENGEGVFGVSRPALDGGPHGKAEERD